MSEQEKRFQSRFPSLLTAVTAAFHYSPAKQINLRILGTFRNTSFTSTWKMKNSFLHSNYTFLILHSQILMDAKKRCFERRQMEQSSRKNSKVDHLVIWMKRNTYSILILFCSESEYVEMIIYKRRSRNIKECFVFSNNLFSWRFYLLHGSLHVESKSTSLFIIIGPKIIPHLSTSFPTTILTTRFESCIPIRPDDPVIKPGSIYVPNCIACWISVMVPTIEPRINE